MGKAKKLMKHLGVKDREVFVVIEVGCEFPKFEAFFRGGELIEIIGDYSRPTGMRIASKEAWHDIFMNDEFEVIPARKWDIGDRRKKLWKARRKAVKKDAKK